MIFRRRKPDIAAGRAILDELKVQGEASRDLMDRYEASVERARTATLSVGKAREERDEYRRVLAAAIATETRRAAEVEELKAQGAQLRHQSILDAKETATAVTLRAEVGRRLDAVEVRLAEETVRRERELADAADRAWAEREGSRNELVRVIVAHRKETAQLVSESSEALVAVRSLLDAQPSGGSASPNRAADARILRGRILVGVAVVLTLLAVAMLPLALLAGSDPERALFIHLASGLRPLHAVLLVVGLLAAAIVSLSAAVKDFERAASPPLDRLESGDASSPEFRVAKRSPFLRSWVLPGPKSADRR